MITVCFKRVEDKLEASKVATGSIYLTLRNILSTVIGVFGLAFLARAITQEDMGTITVLTFILSFIQLISDFGLSQALAKYVAELKGRNEDFSTHFFSSLTFKIPISLLTCLLLFSFSGSISFTFLRSPVLHGLIRLTAIDAFISAAPPLLRSLLLGTGRLKRIAICDVASTAARWSSIALLAYLGYGVYGVVMGWILGDLFSAILYAASSFRTVRFSSSLLNKSISLIPLLLRFSWPLLASSLVLFLYAWYDQALVIAFLPLESVGIYNVSRRAFGVLVGIATALGQSLFPYYGMTYGRRDHEAISIAIKKASRYTMLIIFPLTLGLFSTAKPAITLFAGQQYISGWSILAIMAIFGLTYGISPALSGLLIIYEKTKTVMLMNIASVVFSLILFPAVGIFGLNGLAFMRGASLLLTLILNIYFLSRIVKVEIDKETLAKTVISSAIMASAVFFIQQVYYNKFLLPIYVGIGVIIYIAELRILKILKRSDVELLIQIVGEKNATLIGKLIGFDLKGRNG